MSRRPRSPRRQLTERFGARGGGFWAVSSRFTNVARRVLSGTDLPVINCLVEVGAASQWALPSGGQTLLEGNNVSLLPDHNESATLFGAPQIVGGQLIMINNQLPEMPLGVDGPTAEEEDASWMLVNNRFAGQAEAQWNRLMTLLQADGHKAAAHVLAAQDSDPSPVSGLLFSGGGW